MLQSLGGTLLLCWRTHPARSAPEAKELLSSDKLSRSKKTLVKKSQPSPNTHAPPSLQRTGEAALHALTPSHLIAVEEKSPLPLPSPSRSPPASAIAKKAKIETSSGEVIAEERERFEHGLESDVKGSFGVEVGAASPVKKSSYREYLERKKSSGPIAPGSKTIPEGAPNCLLGLTFVFTGELDSLSREDAQDLVKRYGGKTTTAPSGKTSYVVVGRDAGQSKLEKVEKLAIPTLDEDGLLDLLRSKPALPQPSHSHSSSPVKAPSKKAAPDHAARPIPLQISEDEIISSSFTKPAAYPEQSEPVLPVKGGDLWTDRYAPRCESELIGNNSNYEKLVDWLKAWSPQSGERAVLLSGPPGIGKTTAAHMACRSLSIEKVEMNASDTRSKATLHEQVSEIIDNKSLSGFSQFFSKRHQYRTQVLIMDEVDGMSAGDRGGMAELIQLIKKTKIPIICICNDRSSPKVRSLANYCLDLRFRRPDARTITPRIVAIARKEGLDLGLNTVEELVASTQSDIRQILNLLSTFSLTCASMNYDQSKILGSASKKDVDQGPFDAVPALLGSSYDRMSLADKIDQYFIDSSLVPLMIQENYIKCKANSQRVIRGKGSAPSFMDLCSAAAESISDADWVESLIRGSNQEWSLAPFHAVMSCVRPAYFCHGNMGGRVDFAGWLGQNSKQTKNLRLLGEITKHSYLQTATGKSEMRLCYGPVLASFLLGPLISSAVEGAGKTIELLDTYSLSREDMDSLLDLMVDARCSTEAYAKIPTAVKTALTRKYNQSAHKLPYALGGGALFVKKIGEVDLPKGALAAEGAAEDEDAALMAADNDGGDGDGNGEDQDVLKDKMIKQKSFKKSSAPSAVRGRGRGRGRGK